MIIIRNEHTFGSVYWGKGAHLCASCCTWNSLEVIFDHSSYTPNPKLRYVLKKERPFFSTSRHQRRSFFFLKDEFQCLEYAVFLADGAQIESATNESIKKRSIPSNKKLILEARRKIAVVSLLKKVKNIVQTFSFQRSLYAHEDRAYSPWSTQQIPSHFPIDFHPTGESPPISPVPKKSKLKAQHCVKVWIEVQ